MSFQGVCLDASGWPKYVLTELALGNMKHHLQRRGRPVTVEEFHGYCTDIFSGLVYLHELTPRSIVHRDLKPDNILAFELRPSVTVMKIGDVGLARFISSTSLVAQSAVGSMFYMSPEVSRSKPYDGRADVFSAGVTLCEVVLLFMVDTPWQSSVITSDRNAMIRAAVSSLQRMSSATSSLLADVLVQCTVAKAQNRPTSRHVLDLLLSRSSASTAGAAASVDASRSLQ